MYYLEPKNLLVDTFGQGTAMVKSPGMLFKYFGLDSMGKRQNTGGRTIAWRRR